MEAPDPVDFTTSGTATHLGEHTGTATRIQDHHGNFEEEGTGGKCVVTSTGTYTVTGGTGAFANATGSGTFTAQRDQCAGIGTATYTGTISRPNSG